MKKHSLLLIALCLCLLFPACDASDPENLFEMPLEETAQAFTATEPVAEMGEGYYQYGNMQKNGDFIRYGDQILFIAIPNGQSMLYTYDMTTGEVSLLCKDATCTHDQFSPNCPANKAWTNLEQYDGNLYAEAIELTSKGDVLRPIIVLKDGRFGHLMEGSVYQFRHEGGNLYVRTEDGALLVYENGSDTPRVLIEEYTDNLHIVIGRYLYGTFPEGLSRVDLQSENPQRELVLENCCYSPVIDGQHIYYSDIRDSYRLYRCDMDGSNPELLVDHPVSSGSLNFDDEYLYFRMFDNIDDMFGEGSHDLYRMSKADPAQIEKIAELPESISTVYTVPGYDKLFVATSIQGAGKYGNALFYAYVMNTDGSNITPLELPDYGFILVNQ